MLIVHGLFQAIYEEAQNRKLTYWCALMERSLCQLLRFYGFRTDCVGPDVNLFGYVRPYIGFVADFEKLQSKISNSNSRPETLPVPIPELN